MGNKKILVVTFHFPPSLAARAIQIGKLVKYLLRSGLEIDIITSDTKKVPQCDQGAGFEWINKEDNLSIYRCSRSGSYFKDKLVNFVSSLPLSNWSKEAFKTAYDLLKEKRYLCCITCAHPMDSHLVGLRIKKAFPDLAWLAHFSDPWAMNPMANTRMLWQRKLKCYIEKKIIERADKIIFVSDLLLNYVMNNHPEQIDKALCLPHSYDPELYPDVKSDNEGILTITYAGGLNRKRNIQPLIRVLSNLIKNNVDISRLKLQFVGDETVSAAEDLNSIYGGIAHSVGRVSYTESLRLMKKSGLLLLVDADFENSPYFPSKLADYFGACRPILGITPSNSCSTTLLKKLGMPVFDYCHLDDCARYIAGVLQGGIKFPEISSSAVQCYSAPNVVEQFVDMIAKLTTRR